MFFWFFVGLIFSFTTPSHDQVSRGDLFLPLDVNLKLVEAPSVVKVQPDAHKPNIFITSSVIHLKLTVMNPTNDLIFFDIDDTPMEASLFDGMLPSGYFSQESHVVWMGIISDWAEDETNVEQLVLLCTPVKAGETLEYAITLGKHGNNFGFTKKEGKATIGFNVDIKECNSEGKFTHREIETDTNAVDVVLQLEPESEERVGWVPLWPGRGHVETDSDGIFYWVSNMEAEPHHFTHPSQPRTYTFTSGDDYEDCADSITYNGVTKTLQEWITGLEEDKHQFCASAMWNMQKRTDAFYHMFEEAFDIEFTETGFEDLKGKVARMCSADNYEYNCNPSGTCNMGLTYRHCESVREKLYPQSCKTSHESVAFTKQKEILDLDLHKDTDLPTLRQDMYECDIDKRNCKGGSIPSARGGVKAYIGDWDETFSGKRTINICPIMFWMGFTGVHCRIKDIQDQTDYQKVWDWNGPEQCFHSTSSTIYHELGHFDDIANAGHRGALDNTYRLSSFMTGISHKPAPPSKTPTTSTPTKAPVTSKPTDPPKAAESTTTTTKAAGDCPISEGKYCSSYKIASNPNYYCKYFGSEGTYCKLYPEYYCCLDLCGECDGENEEEEVAGTYPQNGGTWYETTSWTLPAWMEITWDDFPVTPASDAKEPNAEKSTFAALGESSQKFSLEAVMDVFAVIGATTLFFYAGKMGLKFFSTNAFQPISADPEI